MDGVYLIVGYTPDFRNTGGWRDVYRQARHSPDSGIVRRVVFDKVDDPHSRVLVDVEEFPSPTQANRSLTAAKAGLNFRVVDAPQKFGPGAFAYPDGQARSLYFCRSNVTIWVNSCGREPVFVQPWAEHVLHDLEMEQTVEPGPDPDLMLTIQDPPPAPGQPFEIIVKSRWERGEWGWRKFKATGGTLARAKKGDGLLFWPAAGSRGAAVTGWAIEPGRATYAGRFVPPR